MSRLTVLALIPAVFLAVAGQANSETPSAKSQGGAEGALEAAAIQVSANVVAVDAAKRTVSIVGPLGRTNTYVCGPAVKKFDQIKVGDVVKATVIESVAVFAGKSDAPASVGASETVAVSPKGAMPGVVMAKTVEVTGKIEAIDAAKGTVTLVGPMGQSRTFKAAHKENLEGLQKGDDVHLRITEALAITVEKP